MKVQLPDWAEDYWGPCRWKIAYGGRASAKSWTFERMIVLKALQSPLRSLYLREYQNSIADSSYQLIVDQINLLNVNRFFDIKKTEIDVYNGGCFRFKGLRRNPDALKSIEGFDICRIEEANTIPEYSWRKIIPSLRKETSEFWVTYNPDQDDDPIHLRAVIDPIKNAIIKKVNYRDNPWFPESLRQEMERDRKRDYDLYMHVWEGETWHKSEARVFKNWVIDDFSIPENVQYLFGADWGFSVDPTVLIRLFIDGNKLYIDREVYKVGCEIVDTPKLFETIDGAKKHFIRADSARPEVISYMRQQGFNIIAAEKGKGSVEDGISFLNSFDIFVHPRCKKTIEELNKFSYKTHKLTGDVLPELASGFDHCIDAIRYAIEPITRRKQVRISVI